MRIDKDKDFAREIDDYGFEELSLETNGANGINRTLLVKSGEAVETNDETKLVKAQSKVLKSEEAQRISWHALQTGGAPDTDKDTFTVEAHEKAFHNLMSNPKAVKSTQKHKLNEDGSVSSEPADFYIVEGHIERSPENIFGVPVNTSVVAVKHAETDDGNKTWERVVKGEDLTLSFVGPIHSAKVLKGADEGEDAAEGTQGDEAKAEDTKPFDEEAFLGKISTLIDEKISGLAKQTDVEAVKEAVLTEDAVKTIVATESEKVVKAQLTETLVKNRDQKNKQEIENNTNGTYKSILG